MSCITKLLEMKGNSEILPVKDDVVIEGGGKYKGFEYLITFTDRGHRCGYVAIPAGIKYFPEELNIHGGVTFEDEHHSAKKLLPVPCNDTWIGFDAAHYGDIKDMETAKNYFITPDERGAARLRTWRVLEMITEEITEMERKDPESSYKTYEFMENECKSVIEQLIVQAV